MKTWGGILMTIGAIIVLISYVVSTSVDSSGYGLSSEQIINIGKLQNQMLIFSTGAVIFLAGAIFTGFGAVIQRLDPTVPSVTAPAPADDGAQLAHVARWNDETGEARIGG